MYISLNIQLCSFTGELIPNSWGADIQVAYGDQSKKLLLFVPSGSGPSLFGRKWLRHRYNIKLESDRYCYSNGKLSCY